MRWRRLAKPFEAVITKVACALFGHRVWVTGKMRHLTVSRCTRCGQQVVRAAVTLRQPLGGFADDAAAIRSDWKAVGGDLQAAIDKVRPDARRARARP